MEDNKKLIKINNSLVNQFFSYIKNLFSKKDKKVDEVNISFVNNSDEFSKGLQIDNCLGKDKIAEIQEKFSRGLLKEEDISEEDIEKIEELYNLQISDLEKSLEKYKYEIIDLKRKLES